MNNLDNRYSLSIGPITDDISHVVTVVTNTGLFNIFNHAMVVSKKSIIHHIQFVSLL